MKNVGGKIQTIANVFTFLDIVAGIVVTVNGFSQYAEYKENYAWRYGDYSYLADLATNTIILGIAFIITGIISLFFLYGFAQLIINSDKLVEIAEKNSQPAGRRY